MDPFPDSFLDDVIQFWQPLGGRRLGRDDARQIAGNVIGVFELLAQWDETQRQDGGPTGRLRRT